MQIHTFEPRVGGRFQMTLTFSAVPGKSTANTDVVAGRFVEFVSSDSAFAGTMTMRWVLEATADGTFVTLKAENVPASIRQADHDAGMNSSLANLAACVE